jgi:hypothetical protein
VENRYPQEETARILQRSALCALRRGDLTRFAEVALLNDYLGFAYQLNRQTLAALLPAQLASTEDEHLPARLMSQLDGLTGAELAHMAEYHVLRGAHISATQCLDATRRRLRAAAPAYQYGSQDDLRLSLDDTVAIAARVKEPETVVEWAIRNREDGNTASILESYGTALRRRHDIGSLRVAMAQPELLPDEWEILLGQALRLALDDGLDLGSDPLADGRSKNPFECIYAALRAPDVRLPTVPLPEKPFLSKEHDDAFDRQNRLRGLAYPVFFRFLANHLAGNGSANEAWLCSILSPMWPRAFLGRLDAIAAEAAQRIVHKEPVVLGWLYGRLGDLPESEWDIDPNETGYAKGGELAFYEIALDVMSLRCPGADAPVIDAADLEQASLSPYWNPWVWLERLRADRREWLTREAVVWLVTRQRAELAGLVEELPDRAEKYAALAAVAAASGEQELVRQCIHDAVGNLVAHARHKDMLLTGVLEVIQECHRADVPEAREWLLRLAPALVYVTDYTDGDETGHLPRELATVLAEMAPDLLPRYCEWLLRQGEFYNAQNAFHSFLRVADLADPVQQALAMTAVDDESIQVLVERDHEQDPGARAVLESLTDLMGESIIEKTRPQGNPTPQVPLTRPEDDGAISPATYPPSRLREYLALTDRMATSEQLRDWLRHWIQAGKGPDALRMLKKAMECDPWLRVDHSVFSLILPVCGRNDAYWWLCAAYRRNHGWRRYFTYEHEARAAWALVHQHYPERQLRFVQETISSGVTDGTEDVGIHDRFVRLVQYLIFVGRADLAKAVAERMVASALDMVSPVALASLAWVEGSSA